MKRLRNILTVILLALGMLLPATVRAENTVDVKEIVFGHIGDSYEWHITTWGETHVTIPLPVIVHSSMVMDLFGKVYEPYYFPGFAQKMEEQPDFVSKLNYLNLHAAESGMRRFIPFF